MFSFFKKNNTAALKRAEIGKILTDKHKEQFPDGNIFPCALSDREFRQLVTKYLLPDGWLCVDPLPGDQVNTLMLEYILENYKPV